MKRITISLIFFLGFFTITYAADCIKVVLNDNFSSSSTWQSQGNGGVEISNGLCNFNNVSEGSYNRIYRNLGTTLSDTYWKSECDFSIVSPNPIGHGAHAIVIALTAGDLNFITENSAESNQDGIAVTFGSASPTDNNIDNWYFCIQEKKGNNRTSSTAIFATTSITHYYIRLQRTAQDIVKLSVFSDSTFYTHLPGSPVIFSITSTITGLNTIQHGVNEGGSANRVINAKVDNDLICQNLIFGITNNLSNTSVKVYPNPFIDYITIDFPNDMVSQIEIYDVIGNLILKQEANTNKIYLTELTSGVYILKIMDVKGRIIQTKIIK